MKTIYFVVPKLKLKHLILFGIFFLYSSSVNAQSINYSYIDGTKVSFNVGDVKKITFTADVMNLRLLNGSEYTWNVSTINDYKYSKNSLSTEEHNKTNAWQVLVYPNPLTSYLNVQFNLQKEDDISLKIYDFQGKSVIEKNFGKKNAGEFRERIDLINISAGTYFCKIIGEQYSLTKKIIKQ